MTAEPCSCNDALGGAHLFLDDALEPAARSMIEAHLRDCQRCNHTLAFQTNLRATIARAVTSEPLPEDLVRRLLDRLATEPGADTADA